MNGKKTRTQCSLTFAAFLTVDLFLISLPSCSGVKGYDAGDHVCGDMVISYLFN